jgi:hypothetical protein
VIVLAGKGGDRSCDLVLRQYQEPGAQPKESACGGGGVGAPSADQPDQHGIIGSIEDGHRWCQYGQRKAELGHMAGELQIVDG